MIVSCVGQVEQLKQGKLGSDPSPTNFKLYGPLTNPFPQPIFSPLKGKKWKYLPTLMLGWSNKVMSLLWELHCQPQWVASTAWSTMSTACSSTLPTTLLAKPKFPPSDKILGGEDRKGLELTAYSCFVPVLEAIELFPMFYPSNSYLFFSKGWGWVPGHHGKTTKHPSYEKTFPGQTYLPSSCQPIQMNIHIPEETPSSCHQTYTCILSHLMAPSTIQQLPWAEMESS